MLYWAAMFLFIALVAAVLGFAGIATAGGACECKSLTKHCILLDRNLLAIHKGLPFLLLPMQRFKNHVLKN